ncbi:MAG: aldehyde dehydrogenase family protein, partial [Frankiales bacterium]|nr:aldehyde dehydrogenase family protein [Frankiales bacterium]
MTAAASSTTSTALDHAALRATTLQLLAKIGVGDPFTADGDLICRSPITGGELGRLRSHSAREVTDAVTAAAQAFEQWRVVPAPVRGKLVRELGELLREHK